MISLIADELTLVNRIVKLFRRQNYYKALRYMNHLSRQLMKVLDWLFDNGEQLKSYGYVVDEQLIAEMLKGIMGVQSQGDYVLLADLLELQLLPFLQDIQNVLVGYTDIEVSEELWKSNINKLLQRDKQLAGLVEEVGEDDNCVVELTSSGLWTMKLCDEGGEYYYHSNANPALEGDIFAEQYYSLECNCYMVWGLGLGYHIKALLEMDDSLSIYIIEPDLEIIRQANIYADMSWIYDNPRISLLYDPECSLWTKYWKDDMRLIIHYPSLRHINNTELKLELEKLFIRDSGQRNFAIQFAGNFRENVANCDGYVDELRERFEGNNAVIVAAGPSLDKNVGLLSQLPDNTLIIAVGTVFHKLIDMNIIPDYAVFLDAQEHLYSQVEGLENCNIPIICASTACKRIAQEYKGKKYLVCQEGYGQAEEYAKGKGYKCYETGGSVSTIALDICLQLGCKEVAYIGLDLAFTDDLAHASQTSDTGVTEEDKTIMVPAINGGLVASRKLFVIYRDWIEKRASKADAIGRIIDATEGGALIKGLTIRKLEEVLECWR